MELNEKAEIEESIPEGYWKSKVGIIPDDWDVEAVGSLTKPVKNPVLVDAKKEYVQLGIRSHGKGIFYKEKVTGEELGNKRVFWVEPNCFIVNIVFAWERAIARTTDSDKGIIASHRFPMYRVIKEKLDLNYLTYFFKSKRGSYILGLASPGGAGRNKTLGQSNFTKSLIPVPLIKEQQHIAEILSTQDEIIRLKEQLIDEKIKFKKYVMQMLLNDNSVSFKRLDGFSQEWSEVRLKNILDYERPDKYIVTSTEYCDDYKIPVLTANKSFILGYSNEKESRYKDVPVIIFDDFTTANKFVEFEFLVKSSAIKILKVKDKNKYNIRFIYEKMKHIQFPVGDHKRYYISEYQYCKIKIPDIEEQNAIMEIASSFDEELRILKAELEEQKFKKNSLSHLLLTGKIRTINLS